MSNKYNLLIRIDNRKMINIIHLFFENLDILEIIDKIECD